MGFLHEKGESFQEVYEEIWRSSDRVVGIVSAALLEDQLDRALTRFGVYAQHSDAADLAFGVKIQRGFTVGMYGDAGRQELATIKDIRNCFAHELDARSFQQGKVRDLTMGLRLVERYFGDATVDESPEERRKLHPRDWSYWMGNGRRDEALADPRQRFSKAIDVLAWGLSSVGAAISSPPHF